MKKFPQLVVLLLAPLCASELRAQVAPTNPEETASPVTAPPVAPAPPGAPAPPRADPVPPPVDPTLPSNAEVSTSAPEPVAENPPAGQALPPAATGGETKPQSADPGSTSAPKPKAHSKPASHSKRHHGRSHRGKHAHRRSRPRSTKGERTHDGFFLRIATGLAGYHEWTRSDDVPEVGRVESQRTGFGTASDLSIGGTVGRGLVIGGGIFGASVLAGTAEVVEGGPLPPEMRSHARSVTLLAPFVDWYPNPRRGLHISGALGVASLHNVGVASDGFDDDGYNAVGVGLMLAIGHEWFVSEEWSVGVIGRVMGGGLVGKDNEDVEWGHAFTSSPSVLFNVTYH